MNGWITGSCFEFIPKQKTKQPHGWCFFACFWKKQSVLPNQGASVEARVSEPRLSLNPWWEHVPVSLFRCSQTFTLSNQSYLPTVSLVYFAQLLKYPTTASQASVWVMRLVRHTNTLTWNVAKVPLICCQVTQFMQVFTISAINTLQHTQANPSY